MINWIVSFAVKRRMMVLALTFLFAGFGVYNIQNLAVDAVPDITNVQVQINTKAPGFTPLEVEQRITYLVETAMAGIPKLDYTRSLSRYGLSQVTVIFDEGTDIYWARQQIGERIQSIRADLPNNIEPNLGPIASGLGEIFTYSVHAKPNALKSDGTAYNAEDLRTLQDWVIRPQLLKVKGVTEINSQGGFERQYQVAPMPEKLIAYKLTIKDVISALELNNSNRGAGYIERFDGQYLVRSPGQLKTLADIANTVIAKRDDTPVRIKDVANVYLGKELRTGAATYNGEETVLGTAMMLIGENSRVVAKAMADKLIEVQKSLPAGVIVEPVYDRTNLVDKTIATVQKNLFEGAVLVIVILLLLLGNITGALITAMVIPLSMLFAITGMVGNRVSGNLMSLGAIDFGLIVDGAVIVVENCLRQLGMAQHKHGRLLTLSERLKVVTSATKEVFSPAVFGILIIMLVYLPLFALSGVEGKMFQPMAFTVVAALIGALIFAVTFVPAAIAVFVRGKVDESENAVMRGVKKIYKPLLNLSLKLPWLMVSIATVLVLVLGFKVKNMGAEFLPQLDEGDIAMHALRITGTGIEQSVQMQKQLEQALLAQPEIANVFSKIGTADVASDPMPPNVADTFLMLKPSEQWPNPSLSKDALVQQIRHRVNEVPGNNYEFTQPIEMRFNELIAGVRADVALRIYGDDLAILKQFGEKATGLMRNITGATDVRLEQIQGLPTLSVTPMRDHMALLGLTVNDIQQTLAAAVGGVQTGLIYEGDKRFSLLVRLDKRWSDDVSALARLPIALPQSSNPELAFVPLGEVATISIEKGPNQINRESGKRNVVVTANVAGRDLASFVSDAQAKMNAQLNLPSGYWLEYGGTFEQLQSASKRLSLVVPVTLLLIFGLLYSAFGSLRDSLIIFSGVPLALTGGVLALLLRDMPLSISAGVGFIALSGVAVLNGVVMLSFIKQLRNEGLSLYHAIHSGALQRLRPVLMTALVASLGFIPMALNTGTGSEVQRPLATVVVGGIMSSTLLTLLILPALYKLVHTKFKKQQTA
ncbi:MULTISPECIES: CusA/CzcA family heavy metal efflux RND transporter [unclassified Pseudoalteromonas]|jgi:cobalt-zinc-cadmium resistance protein CzcA|uniref:efflux RND transporter permease subunit n=1 Tax=unclassified Pseudoalteromonas TaxID=194690 RepID=UPI0001EF8D41|nr:MULTISPECIES: CusA/CzcA family heavy metal efflux RND transporter [unclassified Pseudoalteromonas]PHQ91220.1 MAG: CusA/CzcA family heavy metal efflux RND transporter [Pseudoalteromonas sp.]ADT69392.1 cobalt-zinc-cadmium resistance protein czcA (cation efflux system protein czcA) [Pseudoalteromonas sp. SM9913]MDN3402519.1 CusA/CzcA family heavy metal efflux RND transporter [Pseudoalteromonas sp. APC 3213]MDN3405921.1 CusA/CzcA family heavy metal efflux RND transporter [Pseudoalteromonas sp. A|tara:strand:- start:16458 stop:19595 length:3138 start_codon:yes stop_codon:yes gene_type:complete